LIGQEAVLVHAFTQVKVRNMEEFHIPPILYPPERTVNAAGLAINAVSLARLDLRIQAGLSYSVAGFIRTYKKETR